MCKEDRVEHVIVRLMRIAPIRVALPQSKFEMQLAMFVQLHTPMQNLDASCKLTYPQKPNDLIQENITDEPVLHMQYQHSVVVMKYFQFIIRVLISKNIATMNDTQGRTDFIM